MGDVDSALPRHFVRNVRSLQHLLLSAVLERKAALAEEFRNRPPLRPFGDAERLGVAFPVMTQQTWENYLDVNAEDPIGMDLKSEHEAVVRFGTRVQYVVTRRSGIEEKRDQLRNDWILRGGAISDDPHVRARDAKAARAHRVYHAQVERQATLPAAMQELELRFGTGDAPLPTLPPLPLRSKASFFEDELNNEFGTVLRNLVRAETDLVEEWDLEFGKELEALEHHLLGPSSLLEGKGVGVLPHPWMGNSELILLQEEAFSALHERKKEMLQLRAYQVELLHSKVVLGKLRQALAKSAYEYKILKALVDEAGDDMDDVLEEAVRYETLTLRVIKRRYKNALLTNIARHQTSVLAGDRLVHVQTPEEVDEHVAHELQNPLSEEDLELVSVATAKALTQYNALVPLLVEDAATWSPAFALQDGLANRCLEAYVVRHEHDTNPHLHNTNEHFNARLLRLLLSSPWYNRNHRGSVGLDEATARVHHWLVNLAHAQHHSVDLNAMITYTRHPPAQGDENSFDPNRPMQPALPYNHGATSYSSLPSLDAATKVAVAASLRRILAPAR